MTAFTKGVFFPPQKVTTRTFSWQNMVVQQWGEEWIEPDIAYEFSNGAEKECTDYLNGGPYQK